MITLITGGVKSGKSWHALNLVNQRYDKKIYLATAIITDDEMAERVAIHKSERDESFLTIEESIEIHRHIEGNILLDCITMWMNNLFYHKREEEWENILVSFLEGCKNAVVVTNETGLGNIPFDPETRRYNRYLGKANVLTANMADEVYMMVSGIPVKIK